MKVSKHSIQCDCYSPAHSLHFVHWDEHLRGDGTFSEESMCIFTQMSNSGGFFRRLKIAFRYLFNLPQSEEYPWADTYLSEENIEDLRKFLNSIESDV